MIRRSRLVYGLLAGVWIVVVAWQVAEHNRVKASARQALINRSRDISTTLGLVIRSQRRFSGVISKERMETALNELIRPGELNAIALLNAAGEVVASAGEPLDLQPKGAVLSRENWAAETVPLMNLVDLGPSLTQDLQVTNLTIVVPRSELTNRPPRPPPDLTTNVAAASAETDGTNSSSLSSGRGRARGPRDGRPWFGRPPWMTEAQYKSLIEKQGVHSFVLGMSTLPLRAACAQDLWLRCIIACFAGVSVAGLGLAWRNIAKSSELQIRLLRASELNTHLKGMNLAAAGLAHETRNPLNIIRGLAQMISKQQDASPEIQKKSSDIIDEADRVAAQLSEFINYSRPREVRRAAVALHALVAEVVRALNFDLEEKHIRLDIVDGALSVEADEQLLRQALFNLLLNAIQAADGNGAIQIVTSKQSPGEASLEFRDNGPGVAPDHRADIFKPYFTTQAKGTGLGLAVVQQIVLAHGWEINCLSNEPRGAIFRITHMRMATKTSGHAT